MADAPLPQLTKDDLEELLHTKVDSFTVSPLTAPGENYGSTILLVEAVLLPDYKKLSIVAKMVSAFPQMREFFHFRETVLKEIYTYVRVRPEIWSIQEEYGVPEELFLDVIPKCLGARTTRGGGIDQPVDLTSVILLENLKESGYKMADRLVGLDLRHLEYVVTRLARFHATVVVIKLKKPDLFKDTVMKACAFFKRGSGYPGKGDGPGPSALLDTLSHLPSVKQYREKIKEAMDMEHKEMTREEPPEAREPFATFVHNDFWTNNMMFAYGTKDDNITGLKIVDFQFPSYGSPLTDLLFLLYSSRTVDVTKEDCDRLIKLYYDEFIKWLEIFGCDTEPFCYETFSKEVEIEGRSSFPHAFIMLRISSLPSSSAPDLSKESETGKMFQDNTGIGEVYFKKVEKLIKEYVDRGWI